MIEVFYNGMPGISVGQRKDGSRCILWWNNSLEWFSSAEFDALIGA
jgi:hypothetical protein